MSVAYRDATQDDLRFVVAAWSSSYKHAHSAGIIHTSNWSAVMHPEINRVLNTPRIRTIVAYEATDPKFLYGFISGDASHSYLLYPEEPRKPHGPLVHYVYVKEPYRRARYARGLFAELGVDPSQPFAYTCRTAPVSKLGTKIPFARWNPLIARQTERLSHESEPK